MTAEPTVRETEDAERDTVRAEAGLALIYYVAVLGYLFVHQENELQHYVTLVGLPLGLILIHQRRRRGEWSLRHALSTVGLRKGMLGSGLAWAVPLGLAVSLTIQLLFSRNAAAFRDLVTSGRVLYLLPIAFALLWPIVRLRSCGRTSRRQGIPSPVR